MRNKDATADPVAASESRQTRRPIGRTPAEERSQISALWQAITMRVAPVTDVVGGRAGPASAPRSGQSRSGRLVALAIAVLVSMIMTAPAPAAAQGHDSDAESSFIAHINEVRAQVGVAPLQFDSQLQSLARAWTAQMHAGNCGGTHICHASPISTGVTHEWAKLGENVGTGPDVASVAEAFVNSPGHYANMIDPEFTHIGVGVMWDGGRLYTTHRFMALSGAPAPAPPPEPEPAPEPEAAPAEETAAPAEAATDTVESTPAPTTPAETVDPEPTPSAPAADDTDAPPAAQERVVVIVDALEAVAA